MPSIWTTTATHKPRPPLAGDRTADVLIIGGGMAGILTAHTLTEAGLRCIVVEAKAVGGGTTGNTTAKITAQHGLIYADLIRRFGPETARQYYEANTTAIHRYRTLAEQFPCDLETKTAHIYATDDRRKLDREADTYHKLGIPGRFVESPPLPIPTVGALAIENQAQFHPLKLLYALADGLEVYEHTFVRKIKGRTAHTAQGKITARHIILATHYPLVNIPGLYAVKLYQHRSYVLALEGAPQPDGMYLDERKTGLSFRTYGDLLFVGGGSHRTGKSGGGYAEPEAFAAKTYPDARVKHRWATQDCMSLDSVPYIGRHQAGAGHLYVASGFNKWGMTGSMAAAGVIADLLVHGESAYKALYNPRRNILSCQLFANLGTAAAHLLSLGGPRCTHMGCKLHKNTTEGSWDCACHGSRFEEGGRLICNPAKRRLRL
ncbi:MAG: FAD-dependent oxidoreductase [Oscillospiraceae bacterium]|nr:FAD-dependent oxidoreductase [Oscillospiraceae bacterium]